MQHHHPEPTLMRVEDDNLCAISLGKEDEEFADTLRMAVTLTSPVAQLRAADDEEELEHNYEDNDSTMEEDVAQRKGKAATSAKHKKKQPRGRSRSDGATGNRSRSTRDSDSECETDDDAA
eukprot:jgi/Tetstr1/466262/TSEL_010818.t1